MHSIDASIVVNASAEDCYRRWADFESLPKMMRRVVNVRPVSVSRFTALPVERLGAASQNNPQRDAEGAATADILQEVMAHGNQVWQITVKGLFGQLYVWTAGIVMDLPNRAISWATTADQEVASSGTINFLQQQAAGKKSEPTTLIDVRASFSPPVGPLGEFLSDMIRSDQFILQACLEDFKAYVESQPKLEPLPQYRSLH